MTAAKNKRSNLTNTPYSFQLPSLLVSKDDIGSVKLLRMLKDSDDESVNVREQSRLRRYIYIHLHSKPVGFQGMITSLKR